MPDARLERCRRAYEDGHPLVVIVCHLEHEPDAMNILRCYEDAARKLPDLDVLTKEQMS